MPRRHPAYGSDRLNTHLQSAGWTFEGTGGGCVAWRLTVPGQMHFLLTAPDGMTVPYVFGSSCIVGLYSSDSGASMDANELPHAFGTVTQALEYVRLSVDAFARIANLPARTPTA